MPDYLKRAKTFAVMGAVMACLWMVSIVAVLVQFVRGFFDTSQWLYVIAWVLGAYVCKSVARDYRATSQRIVREGLESGHIMLNEKNQLVAVDEQR